VASWNMVTPVGIRWVMASAQLGTNPGPAR
jgi:hypothetical protein